MRAKLFIFVVSVAAPLLVACGQEDDAQGNDGALADAAQPVVSAPDAASHDASAAAPEDAGSVGSARPDAGMIAESRDAGRDAAAAADAGPGDAGTPGDAAPATGDAGLAMGDSPCPGDGQPCKILPLGDSITFGLGYSGGYRVELFRKASADNKPITFVGAVQNGPTMVDGKMFPRSNEGHSGWTIDQVAGLVPMPALDMKPHIVLLMAGTNDVNLSRDLANAPKRLGALIDKISAADAKTLIVVAQITPLASRGGAMSPVTTFNKALPEVVAMRASAGKRVVLVDMNTSFPEGGLGDGVHPNQKGYEWMAGVWYQAIGPQLR
jgi:lysophospholipase L1-like esterase